MKLGSILLNLAAFSSVSALITVGIYLFNVWLLSSNERFSPTNALFFEGMLFIIVGLLLLLGRGGINLWSQKAAILSALAGAVYNKDTVGPSEELRKDRWSPEGFTRLALVLMIAGTFMILTYFMTL
jgi:hypothetical protein